MDGVTRQHRGSLGLLLAGGALGAAAVWRYAEAGSGGAFLVLWTASLAALAAAFARASPPFPRVPPADLAAAAGLAAAFAPLYLVAVDGIPVQVNGDEVGIVEAVRDAAARDAIDPFGLSPYFGHPTLLLAVWGRLAGLGGEVGLESVRTVHAVWGLLAVALAYGLARLLLPRPWAAVAAVLVGANHALLMLSRMAMRENSALVAEALALLLLLAGLQRRHALCTFLGGLAAGATWLVYFPARATFPVWLAFLAVVALRSPARRRELAGAAATAAAGLLLVAAPVAVATARATPEQEVMQRRALLVYPEAREVLREWAGAASVAEGYRENVRLGLTAFNNRTQDHAYDYPNPGHGFLDPLTGVLLWAGAAVVVARLRRGAGAGDELLPLTGLAALWLAFAFAVNKAPDYPRMLVTLPFVGCLGAEALRAVAAAAGRRRARAGPWAAGLVLAVAVAWNLAAAWDFVDAGRRRGDDIGSTTRYVERRRDVPGIRFFLAASAREPYYAWGTPYYWRQRLVIFARGERQVGPVLDPARLADFTPRRPFSLLLARPVWERERRGLEGRFPGARVREVTPDGRLVAFEA